MSLFTERVDEFLRETLADAPTMASALGVDGYDAELDDLSERAFENRERRSAAWLHTFSAFADADLAPPERIDRDLLLSVLRGRAILRDWQMWRRQPDTYLGPGLSGVFTLLLQRRTPEPDLARAVAARLRAVPRNIDDGLRNLRPDLVPPQYVERALGQARAAARYARDLVAGEIADPAGRQAVAEAGALAADAFERFAAALSELRQQANGEWAIGAERYSRLLQEKEWLPFDAAALRERGRAEYARLEEDLRRYARQIGGTDDWPTVLAGLNKDHPTTPDAMRQTYADWTEKARTFLKQQRLVSFPDGEECQVMPSPPFQRPVLAVASYQRPPAFSPSMRGFFFVPYPPDGASEEEVQQRLENNSYAGIPTTAVHEAYPGHHWHLSVAKQNPSAVRRTFGTSYFSEGWGLYAERVMREQGFFTDPRQEMSQVEATIFRAARIIVDTSLHMGEMDEEEAVEFMMRRANLPRPTAIAEVRRYCAWPTQASSYLTGCLQIVELRQRYFDARGDSSIDTLRDFHDRLASTGSLPVALAERALFGE